MIRNPQVGAIDSGSRRRRTLKKNRHSVVGNRPSLERLEARLVLSTITWNTTTHPDGGDWDNPADWNGGVVPGPSDTAKITGLTSPGTVFLDTNLADSISSLITDSSATLEVTNGSLTLGAASSSTFGGAVIISSGASLDVGTGAAISIAASQTLTDNGALGFGLSDSVTLDGNCCGSPGQIAVGGTLTADDTTFPGGSGIMTVNSGGHLIATNTTFDISQLSFNNTSVLNSGDLTGNTFNTSLFLPYNELQYLGDNASFDQININDGTLTGGTFNLDLIGTNTTNLNYVFPGGFTVDSGATVAVGPNVPLSIPASETFIDNGTLSFATGDNVTLDGNCCGAPGEITVAGSLTADDMTFPGGSGIMTVNSGGHLIANNTTFDISQLSFNNTSVLNSGDLMGDTFNTTLYLPYNELQYLSDNTSFDQININAGILASGTFNVALIGTITTNLNYVFPGGFTVDLGATVAVGPNVALSIPASETFIDNGTLSFATGDNVTLDGNCCGAPGEITVGGSLTADDTTFPGGSGIITVNSGGHLTAKNTTFDISQLSFNNTSVLNSGDLMGDTFNTTLFLPYNELQYLGDNTSFDQININAGILASGTLNVGLIGKVTTNLNYVFPGGFTVDSGATVAVGSNVALSIPASETFIDNGTLSFATGDNVTLDGNCCGAPGEITVGGSLTANNMTFAGGSGAMTVNSGGTLTTTGSTFDMSSLTLNSGSTDSMSTAEFSGQLNVNSGATINISGDNFTNVGNQGIVATGDPNATINLNYNYWGTTIPSQIEAKILDHSTDPTTRPTVSFDPFVTDTSSTAATPVSAIYSPSDQLITLNATVSDSAGTTVNEGTETFTILNGSQVIGVTTTSVPVVNGAVSATYTLPGGTLPGQYIIEAQYSGSGGDYLPSTDSSHFLTVAPSTPYKLVIETPPSSTATAGQPFDPAPVIYVEDQYGNLETDDDTTVVTATLEAGTGPLRGTTTATVSGGVATFINLYDDTAEIITLKFMSSGLVSATSASIAVSPAAASKVVFDQQPTNTAAGDVMSPAVTVEVEDTFNNAVITDGSTITLTLSSGTFDGGASTATATASSGVATFKGIKIDLPGSYTLTATDLTLTPSSASNAFTIDPPPTHVVFGQQPISAVAGTAMSQTVTVEVEDASNNVVATDSSTVTLTLSTGTFAGGSQTATARASNGIAVFTGLKIDKTGSYTITATDGTLTSSGASDSFLVSPAAADQLVIIIPPYATVTAGTPLTDPIVIDEEDAYGNVVTSDNTTKLTASLASGAGKLYGTTQVTVSGGVASFGDLEDDTAGPLSLQFADGSLPPVTSSPSIVTPAPASTLVIKRPPSGVVSGITFKTEVDAEDPYGNLATSFNGTVTLTNGAGQLSGTVTSSAADGVAAFNNLVATGSGTLSLSATAGSLTSGSGGGITIAVAPSQPPTVVGSLVYDAPMPKKGKPGGKKTFAGYTIDFSTAMNPSSIGSHGKYLVDIFKKGKKKTKQPKPIGFTVANVTSKAVTLMLTGKQTFPNGGEIIVMGSVNGVVDALGVPLQNTEVFTIYNNGKRSSDAMP